MYVRVQAVSVDFEDEKLLSDQCDGVRPGEEDGDDEAAHWKKKKASDSEDDEPPPPYSKTDPQEEKEGPASSEPHPSPPPSPPPTHEPSAEREDRKLPTDETASASGDSSSISSLSRVTSPNRGRRTLSDLTRITPEDEARLQLIQATAAGTDSAHVESLSDSTRVNPGSQPDLGLASTLTEVSTPRSDRAKVCSY